MAISDKAISRVTRGKDENLGLTANQRTAKLFNEYNKDPISFREKYGEHAENNLLEMINRLQTDAQTGKTTTLKDRLKLGQDNKKGGKVKYQYGGMADMSAAPMVKQPQRKKRKASGFRTKYSKGGGVRSSKYKL
tara:strand:+ start:272 stop:676 length:405 start_codon:yes stop_codon:yes gene_type:complete